MTTHRPRLLAALLATTAALALAGTADARHRGYTTVPLSSLDVTEGSIAAAGPKSTLETADPAMRATVLDGGRHSRAARLTFSYAGESTTTVPLGSGEIRRQIGLKLAAADPCNLVYVMWHAYPTSEIEVQVKRNPGQTTSAECGNRGYTTLAEIPLGGDATADHGTHRLDARIAPTSTGALDVAVATDGAALAPVEVPPALATGLAGPIGVRSDNGHYLFRLAGRR